MAVSCGSLDWLLLVCNWSKGSYLFICKMVVLFVCVYTVCLYNSLDKLPPRSQGFASCNSIKFKVMGPNSEGWLTSLSPGFL